MAINSDLNKALIDQINNIYFDAELKMLEKLAKRAKKGITETGWTEEKADDVRKFRKEIEAIANSPSKLYNTKISESLIDAYYKGVNSANKDHGLPKTVIPEFIPAHLQRLVLETNGLITGTSVQVLRNVDDAYRSIVAEVSTGVLVGVDTKEQAVQDALNRFAAKGITGFVDKAGRNWNLQSYVEMAVRTSTANAATQGHIDRQAEIGNDLIKVPGFGNTCPLCAPWENKVLSISGNDPKYPSLASAKAAGLFHPNCKHTIVAYQPELFMGEDAVEEIQFPKKPYDPELYNAQQTQRYNERQIRFWKRRKAVAITKVDEFKANAKINYWQAIQRDHVKQWNLKRKYARENPKKATPIDKPSKMPPIPKDFKPNKKYGPKKEVETKKDLVIEKPAKAKKEEPPVLSINDEFKQLFAAKYDKLDPQDFMKKNYTKEVYVEQSMNLIPYWSAEDFAKKYSELKAEFGSTIPAKAKPLKVDTEKLKKSVKESKAVLSKSVEVAQMKEQARQIDARKLVDSFRKFNVNELGPAGDPERAKVELLKKHAKYLEKNKSIADTAETYSGSAYKKINAALRGGRNLPESASSYLQEAFDEFKSGKFAKKMPALEEDIVVYRHSNSDALLDLFPEKVMDKKKIKDIIDNGYYLVRGIANKETKDSLDEFLNKVMYAKINDKAPVSTSLKNDVFIKGDGGLEIQYYLPKGSKKGVAIETVSDYATEREFLIAPDQEFVVFEASFEKIEGGNYKNIILHVMPTELFEALNK